MKQAFRNMSIRRKLIVLAMSTSGAVLLLVTLAFVANETITFRRTIRQELTALANIIGMNSTASLTFNDQASASKTLEGLVTSPHILGAKILTPDGKIFAEYAAAASQDHPKPGPSSGGGPRPGDDSPEHRSGEAERWWAGNSAFEVSVPILLDSQTLGTVVIRSDSADLYTRLSGFFVMVIFITIGALALAYVISTKLQHPISDPILDLADTMKTVTMDKNYSIRANQHGTDEIGQLMKGFNEMLAQIQARDAELERSTIELQDSNAELKSFIYSAAHDLRRPLVNIKGFTEEIVRSIQDMQAILRRSAECLPENDQRKIDSIFQDDIRTASGFVGSSVERMANLIDALLKLSQVGFRELRREHVVMENLVQSVICGQTHQILVKNITVKVGALPDVIADRTAMDQIMGNLLDNAVKYMMSERRGHIEISGIKTRTGVIYNVRDNGRGIATDDVDKVFDLFRRAGQQDVQGEGVGLSYTRALVRLHGGRIWCESEAGVGSTFSFVIPEDHSTLKMEE